MLVVAEIWYLFCKYCKYANSIIRPVLVGVSRFFFVHLFLLFLVRE